MRLTHTCSRSAPGPGSSGCRARSDGWSRWRTCPSGLGSLSRAEGFDCVFLMGVWRRSAIGREIALTDPSLRAAYNRVLPGWTNADVAGSPYCIQAYEPDDRMGGWSGLDAAHRALHRRGVQLVLDFVPNHTAFDHDWVRRYPERYMLATRTDYEQAPADFRPVETEQGNRLRRLRT